MAEEKNKQRRLRPAGQYYLMEKIAQGGMAEIFKGLSYDVHGIKKTVCIKKILPHLAADQEFIASLIDEAKLAVKLVHGNIAQTYDLGKVGDDYFMVMEYVDGRSLSQIHKRCMSKGQLIPIPYLIYFTSEILGGLEYMHRRTDEEGRPLRIVHRDISPQNIMVSYSGTVKIIDFGIAKAAVKVGSTDSGILKGKFAYMSPEQAFGETTDRRSDIFSLGIILHEMLTGRRLFKVEDSRETIRNVRRAKADPPSTFRKELPEEVDRISMCALAKDRRMRYPSASEMRKSTLRRFLSEEHIDNLLELARLDALASNGDLTSYRFCKEQLETIGAEQMRPPPILRGRDLIDLGWQPGPQLGQILEAVETRQLEGELTSREQAVEWVEREYGAAKQ